MSDWITDAKALKAKVEDTQAKHDVEFEDVFLRSGLPKIRRGDLFDYVFNDFASHALRTYLENSQDGGA